MIVNGRTLVSNTVMNLYSKITFSLKLETRWPAGSKIFVVSGKNNMEDGRRSIYLACAVISEKYLNCMIFSERICLL
jgi:hypothetical protein